MATIAPSAAPGTTCSAPGSTRTSPSSTSSQAERAAIRCGRLTATPTSSLAERALTTSGSMGSTVGATRPARSRTGRSSTDPHRATRGPVGGAAVIGRHGSGPEHWCIKSPTARERSNPMFKKTLIALSALLALMVPAAASAASNTGAVVFSKASTVEGVAKGGLFAVKEGHLNQLTEDPTDTEPNFSPDGRTFAFVRGGDIYSVRPDGSGHRQVTRGPEVDSLPNIAPSGKYVVFERRGALGGPASLYTVGATGGGLRAL